MKHDGSRRISLITSLVHCGPNEYGFPTDHGVQHYGQPPSAPRQASQFRDLLWSSVGEHTRDVEDRMNFMIRHRPTTSQIHVVEVRFGCLAAPTAEICKAL